MNHHVEVVEQYPAALPFALPADQLRAGLAHPELDLVDDGPDLPVVGRRTQHEGVGDHELLAHVVGDDAVGKLVRGRERGGLHKLDGPRCGCHECLPASFGRHWVRGAAQYHDSGPPDVRERGDGTGRRAAGPGEAAAAAEQAAGEPRGLGVQPPLGDVAPPGVSLPGGFVPRSCLELRIRVSPLLIVSEGFPLWCALVVPSLARLPHQDSGPPHALTTLRRP